MFTLDKRIQCMLAITSRVVTDINAVTGLRCHTHVLNNGNTVFPSVCLPSCWKWCLWALLGVRTYSDPFHLRLRCSPLANGTHMWLGIWVMSPASWVQHVAMHRTKLIVGKERWLRGWVPATLPEDLSSILSTHIKGGLHLLLSPAPGDLTSSSGLRGPLHLMYINIHTHAQLKIKYIYKEQSKN